MSLTLPVEEMSRLQVSFKVFLPDGGFSFDMASSPTPCSTRLSGLKLHFRGTHDETGGVTFTVWASGLPETNDEDCSVLDNSDPQLEQLQSSSLNYLDFPKVSDSALDRAIFVPEPVMLPSSLFPCLGNSDSMIGEGCIDNSGLDPAMTASVIPCISSPSELVSSDMMGIFDGHDPFIMGWAGSFLDEHREDDLSQYSDPTYISDMARIEPPATDTHPHRSSTPGVTSPVPPPLAYDDLLFVSVVGPDSVGASPVVRSETNMDETPASESSPSDSMQHDPSSSSPPPDPARPFRCLHADFPLWFKRVYTRWVHMNTHLPGSEKDRKFSCTFDGCSMQFSRKHDRLRHKVGNHGMGTQWNCGPCNKYFSSQSTLEWHHLDKHAPAAAF
ncbi:hypothetical protein C8R43DRAFT_1122831 [Mycena crocata]|nr:hypothetical protein C8R43DRAFT_1122831 [Mycena crocata]